MILIAPKFGKFHIEIYVLGVGKFISVVKNRLKISEDLKLNHVNGRHRAVPPGFASRAIG
jgi:hypothetical protein